MGIAARGLEGREDCGCLRAARQHKALAQDKILKPPLLGHHAMCFRIEVGHVCHSPRVEKDNRYRRITHAAIALAADIRAAKRPA